MSDSLENIICIIETKSWLACKLQDFTNEDYIENIILEISDRTYEILTNQKTSLESIDNILNWLKDWVIN
jgi:hypothetical protein